MNKEDFVIDKILTHRINKSCKYAYAQYYEILYRICWYGYKPREDTWEPIEHISRGKSFSYHNRKSLKLPDNWYNDVDVQDSFLMLLFSYIDGDISTTFCPSRNWGQNMLLSPRFFFAKTIFYNGIILQNDMSAKASFSKFAFLHFNSLQAQHLPLSYKKALHYEWPVLGKRLRHH